MQSVTRPAACPTFRAVKVVLQRNSPVWRNGLRRVLRTGVEWERGSLRGRDVSADFSVEGAVVEGIRAEPKHCLPEAAVGEYLVIECAGAYGFVMGSNYNSRPLAAEVLVRDGQAHLVRRRQTFEDLVRGETIPK